ncbi:MAG: hypothetical protein IJB91_03195 [Oscillospiraceae bacterium]|nr:hypothetical protein [Oscillospiraceae bacterium]MBQ9839808.1 hypothetical protein [Oscillospiraceae bacterium]
MKPEISQLSLREKIGQTAMLQSTVIMHLDDPKAYLQDNPIGGVWHTCNTSMTTTNLMDSPIDNPMDSTFYRNWAKDFTSMLRIPPYLALDGPSDNYATDIIDNVSWPAIGAANSNELAYDCGKYRALATRALGGNWIWSPNIDIASRFAAVSLMRTCSHDPEALSRLSGQIIKGMQDNGAAATIKHFPGKDQVEYRDPHFAPAYNHSSLDEWRALQGKVFKDLIDAGVYTVMVGHHGFPASDDRKIGNTYIPSTLSYNTITKLLKQELGFEGVVITDSIDMAALRVVYPDPTEMYVALLNAGNDVLLNVDKLDYIDRVEQAVKDGRISEERIDDACRRILETKEKIGLFEEQEEIVMSSDLADKVRAVNRKVSEKAITLQCDVDSQLPLDPKTVKNVAIVLSTHTESIMNTLNAMKAAFEKRGMGVSMYRGLSSMEQMEKIDAENDLIIYASYLMPHAPMGGSSFFGEECATFFYAMTCGMEKSIGVSLGSSYVYYDFYENMKMFVHAYSPSPQSQEAFVDAIFGDIPFAGTFPYVAPGPIGS